MTDKMAAETVTITSENGDEIEAYAARALERPVGGVVVIHHMPGYDAATKEITRRFAAEGFAAICPNLYHRDAPGEEPARAAEIAREKGGVPDERLVADVAGAARYLRALPGATGKVGVIGYCSGGRQSFLAACSLELDAAVDCYGPFITNDPPPEMPLKVRSLAERIPDLSCPLLGMFGADDKFPAPEEVADLEQRLNDAGKTVEFHTYEGAGHAFFAADRPSYRPDAATDGWHRILAFFGEHLGG